MPSRPTLSAFALLLATLPLLQAAPLPIANHSFEANLTGPGTFPPLVPDSWSVVDPSGILDQALDAVGVVNPTGTTFFSGVPDGANAALIYLSGDIGGGVVGLSQTLPSTLAPQTTYTLRVAVGNIASGVGAPPFNQFFDLDGFPGYAVQLLAGGVLLAEDHNTLTIGEGLFAESLVQFSTAAAHPQQGLPLEIRLLNLNQPGTASQPGIEVDFDDVRLDALAIPETSTAALLALGALPLLRRRHTLDRMRG